MLHAFSTKACVVMTFHKKPARHTFIFALQSSFFTSFTRVRSGYSQFCGGIGRDAIGGKKDDGKDMLSRLVKFHGILEFWLPFCNAGQPWCSQLGEKLGLFGPCVNVGASPGPFSIAGIRFAEGRKVGVGVVSAVLRSFSGQARLEYILLKYARLVVFSRQQNKVILKETAISIIKEDL